MPTCSQMYNGTQLSYDIHLPHFGMHQPCFESCKPCPKSCRHSTPVPLVIDLLNIFESLIQQTLLADVYDVYSSKIEAEHFGPRFLDFYGLGASFDMYSCTCCKSIHTDDKKSIDTISTQCKWATLENYRSTKQHLTHYPTLCHVCPSSFKSQLDLQKVYCHTGWGTWDVL